MELSANQVFLLLRKVKKIIESSQRNDKIVQELRTSLKFNLINCASHMQQKTSNRQNFSHKVDNNGPVAKNAIPFAMNEIVSAIRRIAFINIFFSKD